MRRISQSVTYITLWRAERIFSKWYSYNPSLIISIQLLFTTFPAETFSFFLFLIFPFFLESSSACRLSHPTAQMNAHFYYFSHSSFSFYFDDKWKKNTQKRARQWSGCMSSFWLEWSLLYARKWMMEMENFRHCLFIIYHLISLTRTILDATHKNDTTMLVLFSIIILLFSKLFELSLCACDLLSSNKWEIICWHGKMMVKFAHKLAWDFSISQTSARAKNHLSSDTRNLSERKRRRNFLSCLTACHRGSLIACSVVLLSQLGYNIYYSLSKYPSGHVCKHTAKSVT
jgi:hypothetical protein